MRKRMLCLAAIMLCAVFAFNGCAPFSANDQFAVLGKIEPSSQSKDYDFLLNLNELYPKAQAILAATVENQSDGCLLVEITQVYKGVDNKYSSFFVKNTTDLAFIDGEEYLLFLTKPTQREDTHTIHYDIVSEQSDPHLVKGDSVVPQSGKPITLYAVTEEVSKLQTTVTVPAYFQYYRDLTKLIEGSDLIFIGTVDQILSDDSFPFYVRDEGFEEMFTETAQPVRISPKQVLKGDVKGQITVLRSQSMVYNTINEATLEPTSYTESDQPPLQEGADYLFFLVGKGDSSSSGYYFMVNPFEGCVQLLGDQLMPVPINAVFSFSEYLPDILSEIEGQANGQSVTVHYPPFEIEPTA